MKYFIFLANLLLLLNITFGTFDTEFLENGDSCTNPKITDLIAEAVIKVGKNFIVPDLRDTKFYLYTRKNMKRLQQLYTNDRNSIELSNFNINHPIRFIIHGFHNTHRNCLSVLLREAYLTKGDFNIIVVDWSVIAASFSYLLTLPWLYEIADAINEFVLFLHNEFQVSPENIYLIGHSLGAHIAGITGRRLRLDKKYNTIFGLDPAGPVFQNFMPNLVLRSGDADYVETIHTDMGVLGIRDKLGDASFYPNYGYSQKRCTIFSLIKLDISCNHASAYIYFARSITEKMLAKPCNSFDDILNRNCECNSYNDYCNQLFQMGGEPSQKKKGVYYLDVE